MSQILKLYDINKIELESGNTSGLNKGLYKITLPGAGVANFYFDVFGNISADMTTIIFFTKSAVTLVGSIEYYTEGDWNLDINWAGSLPYEFDLNTTQAQKINGLYPVVESHYFWPKRLHLTASDACTIYCKISIS